MTWVEGNGGSGSIYVNMSVSGKEAYIRTIFTNDDNIYLDKEGCIDVARKLLEIAEEI